MSQKPSKSAADYNREFERRERKQVFQITPPEGVPISFRRASLASRFSAQFLDLLVTYGALFAILFLLTYLGVMSWETFNAMAAILSFLARAPYYIITELVWNGRTVGKRIAKIRVISMNGRRLDPHQVVVRNLLKEAEVFLPIMLIFGVLSSSGWTKLFMGVWLLVVLCIPLFSKQNQRLGDMIGGTCIVRLPRMQKSREITDQINRVTDVFEFEPHHLEHYGRFELQSLEAILRDTTKSEAAYDRDVAVTKTIRNKIGFDGPVSKLQSRDFLSSFYNAQRAFLEKGQIFGDVRDDKRHRENGTPKD